MQVYQCFSYDIPFSLGIDTGASCNLLTVKAYSKFKDLFNLPLRPTDNNLFSVQGSPLQVLGTIVLPLSLAKHVPPFEAEFFVTSDFALNSDGLLGLHSLINNGIDVFPCHYAISYENNLISAMDIPAPLLTSSPCVHSS